MRITPPAMTMAGGVFRHSACTSCAALRGVRVSLAGHCRRECCRRRCPVRAVALPWACRGVSGQIIIYSRTCRGPAGGLLAGAQRPGRGSTARGPATLSQVGPRSFAARAFRACSGRLRPLPAGRHGSGAQQGTAHLGGRGQGRQGHGARGGRRRFFRYRAGREGKRGACGEYYSNKLY